MPWNTYSCYCGHGLPPVLAVQMHSCRHVVQDTPWLHLTTAAARRIDRAPPARLAQPGAAQASADAPPLPAEPPPPSSPPPPPPESGHYEQPWTDAAMPGLPGGAGAHGGHGPPGAWERPGKQSFRGRIDAPAGAGWLAPPSMLPPLPPLPEGSIKREDAPAASALGGVAGGLVPGGSAAAGRSVEAGGTGARPAGASAAVPAAPLQFALGGGGPARAAAAPGGPMRMAPLARGLGRGRGVPARLKPAAAAFQVDSDEE